MRTPPDAAHVIVDTPAAVTAQDMPEMTKSADAIIVPVLPSDIDIHACSRCIADLLLIAKVRRDENRIGVIANRVKRNTVIYQSLMRFLETLRIPVIATLRDSQNTCVPPSRGSASRDEASLVAQDLEDWAPLLAWLKAKEAIVRSRMPASIHCRKPLERQAAGRSTFSRPRRRGPSRPSSCSCASCRDCW